MGTAQSRRVADSTAGPFVRIRPNGCTGTTVTLPVARCSLPPHARRAIGADGAIVLDAAWGGPRKRWQGPLHPETHQPVPATLPAVQAAARWLVHGPPAPLPLPARLLLSWLGCPASGCDHRAAVVALPGVDHIRVFPNSVGRERAAVAVPLLRRCQVPRHLVALAYVLDPASGDPVRIDDASEPLGAVYLDMDEAWGRPGPDWVGPVLGGTRQAVVTGEVLNAAADHLRRYAVQGVRAPLGQDTAARAFVEWLGCPVAAAPPEVPALPFSEVPMDGVGLGEQTRLLRRALATDRDFVSVMTARARVRSDQPPRPDPDPPRQGVTRVPRGSPVVRDEAFYSGLVLVLPNSATREEVGQRSAVELVLDSPCRVDMDAAFVCAIDGVATPDTDAPAADRRRLTELGRPVDSERELVALDMDELWGTVWGEWWGPVDTDGTPFVVTAEVLGAHSVASRPAADPLVAATVAHLRHWLGCADWHTRQAVPLFRLDDAAPEAALPTALDTSVTRPFVLDQGGGVIKVYVAGGSGVCAVCRVSCGAVSVVAGHVASRASGADRRALAAESARAVLPDGGRLTRLDDTVVPEGALGVRAFQGDASRLLLVAGSRGGALRWAVAEPGAQPPTAWVTAARQATAPLPDRGAALAGDVVFVADGEAVLAFHEQSGELLRTHDLRELLGAPSGFPETALVPVCGAPFPAVLAGGPGWRNAVLLHSAGDDAECFGVVPTVEPGPLAWNGVLAAVCGKSGDVTMLCVPGRRRAPVTSVFVRVARPRPWVPPLARVTAAGPRAQALLDSPFVPGLADADRQARWMAETRTGLRDQRRYWELLGSRQPFPPGAVSPRQGGARMGGRADNANPQKRRRRVLLR